MTDTKKLFKKRLQGAETEWEQAFIMGYTRGLLKAHSDGVMTDDDLATAWKETKESIEKNL